MSNVTTRTINVKPIANYSKSKIETDLEMLKEYENLFKNISKQDLTLEYTGLELMYYYNQIHSKQQETSIKKILSEVYKKMNDEEEFICGFDKDLNTTHSFTDDSIFTVSKERSTGKYYYTLLKDNNFYLLYAYEFLTAYMLVNNIEQNIKPLTVDSLYDVDSLTSAKTLKDLLTRLSISVRALCDDESVKRYEDALLDIALNNV